MADPIPPPAFAIAWWPLDRVKPYRGNPRAITPAAIDKVAGSLRAFGWRQPLVVEPDGTLIAGHVRFAAAQQLGQAMVPVHVADGLTPEQVRAYRLADNRTADETAWDPDRLRAELEALGPIDLAAVTAFDPAELDRLLADLAQASPSVASADDTADVGATENGFQYQEQYAVLVVCTDADHQRRVYDELTAAGHTCKVVAV